MLKCKMYNINKLGLVIYNVFYINNFVRKIFRLAELPTVCSILPENYLIFLRKRIVK